MQWTSEKFSRGLARSPRPGARRRRLEHADPPRRRVRDDALRPVPHQPRHRAQHPGAPPQGADCGRAAEQQRYSERPPRDEYVLTEAGRDFLPVLQVIGAWGRRHNGRGELSYVVRCRDRGDGRAPRDRSPYGRADRLAPVAAGPARDDRRPDAMARPSPRQSARRGEPPHVLRPRRRVVCHGDDHHRLDLPFRRKRSARRSGTSIRHGRSGRDHPQRAFDGAVRRRVRGIVAARAGFMPG